MVERSPHHPKVEGLSPGTGAAIGGEKINVTNTLAYSTAKLITGVKSFVI
jgi:hypothetical protein